MLNVLAALQLQEMIEKVVGIVIQLKKNVYICQAPIKQFMILKQNVMPFVCFAINAGNNILIYGVVIAAEKIL
jgi:hypothetical protein